MSSTATYSAASVADAIAALTKGSKKISFAQCKIGDAGAEEFARSLKKHDNVIWLGIFDQELSSVGVQEILNALRNNKSIFHLDFGRNQIGDDGISAICSYCASNKSVEELYLWKRVMRITDEGADMIEHLLLKNRVVRIVDINDNPEVSQVKKNQIAALLKQGPSRVPASPRAGPMKN